MSALAEALEPFSAVLVTGGSSGIGKSFIQLCRKLKPELLVCNFSRREPANFSGKNLNHFACDLSRPADIEHAAGQAREFLVRSAPAGRILLINNSGFGAYGRFPEPNLARHLEMLDVNVRAVVHLTGLFLPLLLERGGAIVTVASTAAFQPTPHLATYGATKAFVLNWSHALNVDLRGTGVHALVVCPGPTKTSFFRAAGLKPGNEAESTGMTSEAVVEATLRALRRRRAQVVPGWRNKLIAAASSPAPKALVARVSGFVIARHRIQHTQA